MEPLCKPAGDMFGARVSCGLNGAAAIGGAGKTVSGCPGPPIKNVVGMLKELDSGDADGAPRPYSRLLWYRVMAPYHGL